MSMELSLHPDSVVGLKRLGNSSLISDNVFARLLDTAVDILAKSSQDINCELDLSASKGDVVKEAYAALLVLMVEGARCNASPDQLNKIIADLNWSSSRSNHLSQLYSNNLLKIQAALSRVGNHPPHVVDVHWQLNCTVKSSVSEHLTDPVIMVQLVTEGEKSEDIKFFCSVSELQDLQAKLKDALRHIDHIGQLGP